MSKKPVLSLRPAGPSDARRVWAWRNDPAARAASRQSEPITWEDHSAWFSTALDTRRMLIGELDGEPAGLVRFDPDGEGWVVSINLAPEMRGKGLGGRLLAAAVAPVRGPLTAEIRDGNTASERIFAACGFRPIGRDGGFGRFRRD